MEKGRVFAVTLARAAEIVGGTRALRDVLGVRQMHLDAWLSGRSPPPPEVFLKAVDLIEAGNSRFAPAPGIAGAHQHLLQRAIDRTGAHFGTLQLLHGDTLHIAAQRGFQAPFLEYFARVTGPDCACGAALASGQQLCVADTATHPIFADTAAGVVLAKAGVRAVESTPLFARDGKLLGVLSTHFKSPHAFGVAELAILDEIAAAGGAALSHARSAI